ncbi:MULTISPECIES: acyl-CoA dehydrogenase family protein [Pseudonocardia]|jgi:alkylation response protein AidB-like acyl-CoA dehydrogenase|uniref:Alkylation response protein AidB-like acyl-CoA dehydrogenase n=1 Tax=Pseudonocardia alni TaxID=33907 RepID=A0A852W675_PSEA5|nr:MULTISPECIES: acyl-CoA dehydrogenase family protein [Pseudonocardia]MYW70597.1 acyl-CoA dehydrogenase [Pseudonocardia sp. SID8383]NYG04453.1 alkylation response protein AidB-like acyl-CoA dehydrogenase [Pseudonocardia antarctica]OJG08312.1 Acyl-CoA dehydrogenase [Pseudonocardia autotrophica]PKB30048.1 alkylation response protein AidB-like acyl-CoA dehydrogenase [Pseudonocardia alni]
MDFRFTDEQRLYRDTLRAFVDKEIVPVAREWEQSGRYPTEIVEGMKKLGLFGLAVPESYGGLAADTVSFALTFEEISRGWMGIAGILGSHSVSCFLLANHGTEEQKQRYLPELATGARRTGIALTEPGAGTDLQGIRTTARRDGDDYVIDGTKMWITNARHADPLPVLVKTDPSASPAHTGMSILLVEAGTPGFEVTADIGKLGYKGTESCEVVLDGVRVPSSQLLGGVEGRGLQQALSSLETGRINIAARSVGIAQRAYDEALSYAREREAFGRPIGDFQAVQQRLAQTAVRLQAARLMTYWAASRMDDGVRMDTESGMAKIFASEQALECALDAMRIHGGYGYSTEFEVERLYRDAPLMSIGEGTNDVLRGVVAKALLSGKATVR